MDFCQFTPAENLTLGDSVCERYLYFWAGGLWGDMWILDSRSLFMLIRQHNLEVSLWVDHRLCLFVIIISLNNKNLEKSQNLDIFGWYVRAVGAEGGAVYHQPENNSDMEQCWGERPAWKLCMGTSQKIRFSLWKFSFGWGSLHIWQLPLPSPLPRTLLIFQKKGGWSSAAPPSSPLQATSESSAKSLPDRHLRPDVLSSLSVHLQAVSPGTSCSPCHCQILISSQGWEKGQENAACQHWLDWLVESR